MTTDEMRTIIDLNDEIRTLIERIEILEASAEKITQSFSGMPCGSGISDKTGDYASMIADEKSELKRKVMQRQATIKSIKAFVESAEDWQTREALVLRFVNGYSFRQIAKVIGMSSSGVRSKIERFMEDKSEKR